MGGLQGLVYDRGQIVPDRVQVHGVLQAGRERRHGLVGVVPGAVEPPVHHLLHPPPQRIEQRRRSQRGGGHRDRGMEPEHLGGQQHQARVDPDQQAGDDRVGQGPADDAVDVIQPVPQDPDADADRESGQPGQ